MTRINDTLDIIQKLEDFRLLTNVDITHLRDYLVSSVDNEATIKVVGLEELLQYTRDLVISFNIMTDIRTSTVFSTSQDLEDGRLPLPEVEPFVAQFNRERLTIKKDLQVEIEGLLTGNLAKVFKIFPELKTKLENFVKTIEDNFELESAFYILSNNTAETLTREYGDPMSFIFRQFKFSVQNLNVRYHLLPKVYCDRMLREIGVQDTYDVIVENIKRLS
jgi:hypothetical protein